ncbi:MAG: hydroxyacylglutathione hydrolase [Polyangiaceae bacterium]|nr:hydroxyacylglutathione hydrolase [Polyangiaceae bacterium]
MPRLVVVPCLRDNYAYLTGRGDAREVAIVDPSEPDPVVRALDEHGLRPVAILCTHHHYDHVGGVEPLVERYGPLPVYGHRSDAGRVPRLDHPLDHGDELEAAGLRWRALHVPGHTLGALAYVGEGLVFTGDTLFGAGCGRLFEGTAELLYASLAERLGRLPGATLVYPGHEYTESNLRFASAVEADNAALAARTRAVAALRSAGAPSVPSTIADELATNPFLRVTEPAVRAFVEPRLGATRGPAAVFAALRAAKDEYRG